MGDIVTESRSIGTAAIAAIAGLIAITAYLVVERAVAEHLPIALCLRQLLQWDASNAYGVAAFAGGWTMAMIGFGMDLVVSLVWALLFTAIYLGVAGVRRNVVVAGLIFGAVVMVVMLYAVVPIGHAIRMPDSPAHVLNVLVAHTIFFGLPLALTVRSSVG
ncbi:MAG TPA: hypothetical protein VEW74_01535 [Candidatus Nitrosotalea sp.]|nr:hypothetical protein [Candidatus Nitrosotalea sp.]